MKAKRSWMKCMSPATVHARFKQVVVGASRGHALTPESTYVEETLRKVTLWKEHADFYKNARTER